MLNLPGVPIDPLGLFAVTGDVIHGVVHAKKMHSFGVNSVGTAFDIAAPIKIVITTGKKEVHWEAILDVFGGRVVVEQYVGATVTGGTGSDVPLYNHHQGTAENLISSVLLGPTVTANGNKVAPDRYAFGSATGSNRIGSTIRSSAEWILPANSVNLFVLTTNTDNTWASFIMDLYERNPNLSIYPWSD